MPHNKDIVVPDPVEISEEVKIQANRNIHVNIVRNYMNEFCDRKGTVRDSQNLTEKEIEGRKQIREGILNKGWVLKQTSLAKCALIQWTTT